MARARSAAVRGAISPALLDPSVTSTITRLLASERRRRVRAVASPEPMAVPSGSMSRWTSSSWRRSTAVSVVGGALVKLLAAKITSPMRSEARRRTNSETTSFATAIRFLGWKSCAAIEPEMSRATTMSTPRVFISSLQVPDGGQVVCAFGGRAGDKGDLDRVRGRGEVLGGGQEIGLPGTLAEERQHLRGRHLQRGSFEPPLQVALGDRGEGDVERPVLAAGE